MKNRIKKGIYLLSLFTTVVSFSTETQNSLENGSEPIEKTKLNEPKVSRPVVRVKDNLLLVSQMSFDEQPVNIKLYFNSNIEGDTPNELIYSEEVKNTALLERIYSLNDRAHGKYKLVLTSANGQFSELFYL